MPAIKVNGIELFYEDAGPRDCPAILLVMGLAAQMTAWPPEMLEQLHEAGFRTIRFDNRDIGLSEKLGRRGTPNLLFQIALSRLGIRGLAPYRLPDMARDGIRLLDALKVDQAHIVGASMGGMISQILCANFPERVTSLTAVMTSTNRKGLPTASPKIAHLMLRPGPVPRTTEEIVERSVRIWKAIATPDGGRSDEELHARVAAAVARSYSPKGQRRQLSAIIETGDLRRWTRRIKAPTLVIHGDADPLVNIAGGKDVAANIRGSRLEVISGMAHDLPPRHLQTVTQMIIDHARAAEHSCIESAA